MIKLSLQSLSYRDTFNAGKITLLEIIDKAAEYQMDGVDLHYTHFASTDDDYLEEIKQASLKRGLHMCYIGVSNNFGKIGDELREQIDLMKKWIDVAAKMGIPMVRAFGSFLPKGESEEEAWPRLVESTKEVAEYGQAKGIVVGLHNHNHGCVTRTSKEVKRILEGVDNPYLSHILDTGQYVGSPGASGADGKEDPALNFYGSIEETAPLAVHVRAKIYRISTGEEAWLDYPRIFKILNGVDYNGWVSVVYEGQADEAEETAVPKAVSYLRNFVPGS